MNLFWPINNKRIAVSCALIVMALTILACGGGPDDPVEPYDSEGRPSNWETLSIAQVDESGTTVPFVVARKGSAGNVHFAWYNAVETDDQGAYHQLHHLVWNASAQGQVTHVVDNRPAPSGVDGFDRCDQFDMAVDDQDTPVLIYPTYEVNDVLQQVEADIMVNLLEGGTWQETTGAIGYVERNPVYQDGHVTENMSVKIDSQGDIHFCYQYFTEGMDSANYRYPDLYYVHRDRAGLADPITAIDQYAQIEELVDGNAFSTYGVHNTVGDYCQLILNDQDLPVIVYAERGENFMGNYALKMAYKDENGQWHRQTVDTLPDGWEVGGISAAFYPEDPEDSENTEEPEDPDAERPLGIAYAVRLPDPEPDSGHHLRFASNQDGQWVTQIVDETTWCGTHCTLAFTADGRPAIAYFDEQSHSGRTHQFLKYAEYNGLQWNQESASEYGGVGRFNTLWFDESGVPHICSYSDEDDEIVVIRQTR